MVTAQLVWSVFSIACTSIGKAGLTVAAGVLLTRRGAFTPEVRREGVGSILFHGTVDCRDIDFNHVVRLGVGEVLVYPDGMDKPPVGEGLNRMATVTWAQHFCNFANFLQIFGGLVLGCIKTKFCKKICV